MDNIFLYKKNKPYPYWWWNETKTQRYYEYALSSKPLRAFASGRKIIWKGSKKTISRKISLEELKTTLKELGFYDGD